MDAPAKSCFIAMPVTTSKAHAEHFGDPDHWDHVMESLFVPAVEAAGFEPWRPVARGSHMIHAEIVRQLEQADMVLCDMSQANPNVFFELGVRTSVNKPVALVRCDASVSIPFDVSGINTHTYDPSLKAWLVRSEIDKLAEHLSDAEASCAGENPMWRQFGMVLKAQEPTAGGTKEEAMLEVLSRQVSELADRVNDRSRWPHFVDSTSRYQDAFQGHPPVYELVEFVEFLAKEYGQSVEVQIQPDGGVLVVLMSPDDGPARAAFRSSVQKRFREVGLGVEFGLGFRARPNPNEDEQAAQLRDASDQQRLMF